MNQTFLIALLQNQWTEISHDWVYKKYDYTLQRDTGSWWMIINNGSNSRVFDFPEPKDSTANWTVNLIEHLCKIDKL